MTDTHRIRVPPRPEPPPPPAFPVVALLAPAVASVAMWAVTGSPLTLLFALLGPVIAIGTVVDGRWQRRRRIRRDAMAASTERERVLAAIAVAHDEERRTAWRDFPGVEAALRVDAHDPQRWSVDDPGAAILVAGVGGTRSAVQLDGEADEELQRSAAQVDGMPALVRADRGIAITGPLPLARALLRTLALQLAHLLPPEVHRVRTGSVHASWVDRLPHPVDSSQGSMPDDESVEFLDVEGVVCARITSRRVADATIDHAVVVRIPVHADAAASVTITGGRDDHQRGSAITPRFTTASAAHATARGMAALARAGGRGAAGLPEHAALSELLAEPVASVAPGLAATVAIGARGPVTVDLVRDGPHALIAGATGTGKSELLISWVLAMAAGRSTDEVTFLLVDFKGGSAFATLARLPHCVGLITDLDAASADRALASLRAELHRRERALAEVGCRSIDDAGHELARLVIVIDEYAAMLAALPHLAPIVADIAARGRSLGVHLVLCTQRPSGTVHEAVLANTGLRISLRVLDAADSRAVLGRADAATLPPSARGRALIGASGGPVQFAIADTEADVARVVDRTPAATRTPHQPWVAPLPTRIDQADLPVVSRGIAFGMVDQPDRQRHDVAVYDPARDGNLLIIGASGAGRTTALTAIAAGIPGARIRRGVSGVWDAVAGAVEHGGGPLLLDDLDAVMDRLDDEHRFRLVRRLMIVAGGAGSPSDSDAHGDPRAHGIAHPPRLMITARRIPSALQPLLPLLESRLILRVTDQQEHLLAGGTRALFSGGLHPGAGEWRGHRVQVVHPAVVPDTADEASPGEFVPDPERDVLVISRTPARTATLLRGHASHEIVAAAPDPMAGGIRVGDDDRRTIHIADPERWQLAWSALPSARATHDVLVHGVGEAELRTLLRERIELPPFEPGADAAWLLRGENSALRVRL